MEISNNFNNPNNKKIFFGDNRIKWVKYATLTSKEFELIRNIRSQFDAVSSVYSKMGPDVQSQFKGFHSKLVEVPKLRGYIFDVKDTGRLQLCKTKTGTNNDEILTFSVLNGQNEARLHFRVNKNGDCYISDLGFGEENIPQNKLDAIKRINAAMETLKKYAENFLIVRRMIETGRVSNAEQAVSKIDEINAFSGYKDEINTLMSKFHKVNKLLNKNQGQMVECKREFFGYNQKSRGWTFKNPHNGKSYMIFPMQQKATNSLCTITEISKDGSKKIFAFCDDGRVAIPVGLNEERIFYLRPYNMQFLTEKEAKSNHIEEMISFVDKKIDEFEYFILKKRHQTPQDMLVKQLKKQQTAYVKEHRTFRSLIERLLAKQQDAAEKAQPKPQKTITKGCQNSDSGKTLIISQPISKSTNELCVSKEKPSKIKPKSKTPKTKKPVQKSPKQTDKSKPTLEIAMTKTNNSAKLLFMPVENIVASLNKIFDTEPSKRSPHLIHEMLANGNIFRGRFHIERNDGSKITVTRVRSSKFDSFTYYSLKITEKDGITHFINIDPSRNLIINSVDGKPTVKHGRMKFYTSFEYLGKDKWASEIPQYIEEITKQTKGKPKFIKFVPTQNAQIQDRERKVFTIIKQCEQEDPFLY